MNEQMNGIVCQQQSYIYSRKNARSKGQKFEVSRLRPENAVQLFKVFFHIQWYLSPHKPMHETTQDGKK